MAHGRQMPQVHNDGMPVLFGPIGKTCPWHDRVRRHMAIGKDSASEYPPDFVVAPPREPCLLVRRQVGRNVDAVLRMVLGAAGQILVQLWPLRPWHLMAADASGGDDDVPPALGECALGRVFDVRDRWWRVAHLLG